MSIATIIAFFYYKNFVTKTSLGVNNIGDQLAVDLKPIDIQKKEDLPPAKQSEIEEWWFMEANYYSIIERMAYNCKR